MSKIWMDTKYMNFNSLQIHFIMCPEDVVYVPSTNGFEGYKDTVLNFRPLGTQSSGNIEREF